MECDKENMINSFLFVLAIYRYRRVAHSREPEWKSSECGTIAKEALSLRRNTEFQTLDNIRVKQWMINRGKLSNARVIQ